MFSGSATFTTKNSIRFVAIAVATCVMGTSLAIAADIEFPDANLDQVIRELLKKRQIDKLDKAKKITDDDVSGLYFLPARNRGIANLEGLQHCKNLAEIDLSQNKITEIAPLQECVNVQSLTLNKNEIKDLKPLEKLIKLQYLQLDDNRIESIDAVANLKALSALYVSRNKIASLQPVAGLPKLCAIYAAGNQITDLGPVRTVKWLERLDVRENSVKSVEPLNALTELRFTFLEKNQIADWSPIVESSRKDATGEKRFAPYWQLYVAGNPTSEAAKKQLAELKQIGVRVKE